MTGTLEHLHPTTLLIGGNVRDNVALDPQFVASVRKHGVLQPITAIRTNAGIEVHDGQRRTLAAREAKLDTMPVYVLDGQASDDKTATAERIAHQVRR
jgi:ParB family transcriptional regulator, chromosome partitioning protein